VAPAATLVLSCCREEFSRWGRWGVKGGGERWSEEAAGLLGWLGCC